MLTSTLIEAALRNALPPELHPQLASIARILEAALSGAMTSDTAETYLAKEPAFTPILRELARLQPMSAASPIAFGQDAQLGDVGIHDIVGGNLLSFTINNYYREEFLSHNVPARPEPLTSAPQSLAPPLLDAGVVEEPLATFVAGPPIMHPRAFFGREVLVRRIFGLLKRPPLQNAVIIGPRRSGKSSLLNYLRAITRTPTPQLRPGQRNDWLDRPERVQWVLVNFQDARLSTKEGLLRHILAGLGLSLPEPYTLDRFLDAAANGVRGPTVILLDEIG